MKISIAFSLLFLFVIFFNLSTNAHSNITITAPTQDTLQNERDYYINAIKIEITGKEKISVDSVFKNLKVFGGFPAENLLIAMNSWSRALGVSCTYCHSAGEWDNDSKPEKDIARQMSEMTSKINSDLLKNIKGLSDERHIINCTSCHNGKLKPALKIKD